MTPAEMNYPVHEQELLALVSMVRKFSYWLLPIKFLIRTDHKSIEALQTQPVLSKRQIRWVIALQSYDMQIKHIAGPMNNVADFLSRSPAVQPLCGKCKDRISVNTMSTVTPGTSSLKKRILDAASTDDLWKKLEDWTSTAPIGDKDNAYFTKFSKRGNLWFYSHNQYIGELS
jgi:hypothetical protein